MVETKWRAVAIGFLTIAVLTIASASVQQLALLGGTVAALTGGLLAGYYARSGRIDGAWNGFLAGSIGALVAVAVFVSLGLAVSIVGLSLGGVFTTISAGLAALVFIVVGAIPAAIGGFLGGMLPAGDTEDDDVVRPAA